MFLTNANADARCRRQRSRTSTNATRDPARRLCVGSLTVPRRSTRLVGVARVVGFQLMAAFFACAAAQAAEPPESQALASALRQLEYGDFETAESALRPIAENGGVALSTKQDRLEALRAYGIA